MWHVPRSLAPSRDARRRCACKIQDFSPTSTRERQHRRAEVYKRSCGVPEKSMILQAAKGNEEWYRLANLKMREGCPPQPSLLRHWGIPVTHHLIPKLKIFRFSFLGFLNFLSLPLFNSWFNFSISVLFYLNLWFSSFFFLNLILRYSFRPMC